MRRTRYEHVKYESPTSNISKTTDKVNYNVFRYVGQGHGEGHWVNIVVWMERPKYKKCTLKYENPTWNNSKVMAKVKVLDM